MRKITRTLAFICIAILMFSMTAYASNDCPMSNGDEDCDIHWQNNKDEHWCWCFTHACQSTQKEVHSYDENGHCGCGRDIDDVDEPIVKPDSPTDSDDAALSEVELAYLMEYGYAGETIFDYAYDNETEILNVSVTSKMREMITAVCMEYGMEPSGALSKTYTVALNLSDGDSYEYTGDEIKPASVNTTFSDMWLDTELVVLGDVYYTDNTRPGTAKANVEVELFDGQKIVLTKLFSITEKAVSLELNKAVDFNIEANGQVAFTFKPEVDGYYGIEHEWDSQNWFTVSLSEYGNGSKNDWSLEAGKTYVYTIGAMSSGISGSVKWVKYKDVESVKLISAPNYTTYVVGNVFPEGVDSLEGLELEVTYKDKTTEIFKPTEKNVDTIFAGKLEAMFDFSNIDYDVPGTYPYDIYVNGCKTSFDIQIVEFSGILEGEHDVTVSVPADKEEFTDVFFKVEDVTSKTEEAEFVKVKMGNNQAKVMVFDMFLEDGDGVVYNPEDCEMTVTIPIPEGWDASTLKVYYVDSASNVMQDMKATVNPDGKTISFKVKHFSYYALVSRQEKAGSVYEGVEAFVAQLYNVCLDRNPDQGGLNSWTKMLKNKEITGVKAAYGFIFSNEFKNKNLCNEDYVKQLYKAFLGREADAGGKATWVGLLESGMTREEVFNGFALSNEFKKLCNQYGIEQGKGIQVPANGTLPKGTCVSCGKEDGVTGFVKRLYSVCLNREADAGGLSMWTEALRDHTQTGRSVAYGFIFSNEFKNKNYSNEDYVEYLYEAFMGRSSDAGGKAMWVKLLESGEYDRLAVFDGFVGSQEFTKICNSYGITRD